MTLGAWDRSGVVRSPDIEHRKTVRISKYGWWPSYGRLKIVGHMRWSAISQFGRERFYKNYTGTVIPPKGRELLETRAQGQSGMKP